MEPSVICQSDGKGLDGAMVASWRCGRALVWDATCSDTFATSHVMLAMNEAGAIANQAEDRKEYTELLVSHHFVPVAIETSVFRQGALSFIRELGSHLQVKTGEPQTHHHLKQRIAVAMQRAMGRQYRAP